MDRTVAVAPAHPRLAALRETLQDAHDALQELLPPSADGGWDQLPVVTGNPAWNGLKGRIDGALSLLGATAGAHLEAAITLLMGAGMHVSDDDLAARLGIDVAYVTRVRDLWRRVNELEERLEQIEQERRKERGDDNGEC